MQVPRFVRVFIDERCSEGATMKLNRRVKQLIYSTVRLEMIFRDKDVGSGTAFMYVDERESTQIAYLVTNKHVVHNAAEGQMIFTAMKPGTGQDGVSPEPILGHGIVHTVSGNFDRLWHGHPNKQVDIAVLPFDELHQQLLETKGRPCIVGISSSRVPSQEDIENLDAVEDVLIVGYPKGVMDSVNLNAIARLGVTATPYEYDYEGEPAFLVDASVFDGSSGSPIFFTSHGSTTRLIVGPSRDFLLGVLAKVLYRTEDRGKVEFLPVPASNKQSSRVTTREMIDLGLVYKAYTIDETIADLIRCGGIDNPSRRSLSYDPRM